jgi:hypothetical protein
MGETHDALNSGENKERQREQAHVLDIEKRQTNAKGEEPYELQPSSNVVFILLTSRRVILTGVILV